MGKKPKFPIPSRPQVPVATVTKVNPSTQQVGSLLAAMVDGKEYGSIVDKTLPNGRNIALEVVEALAAIEAYRGRRCIAYVGNVVRPAAGSSIESSDDLPFAELVQSIPANEKKVDVFLATGGGSGQQVVKFVNALRARFDEVDFILPSTSMSAGTLFALSADNIWMNPLAAMGPVDPQIPTKDGRFVPAQALLLLVAQLQKDGQKALEEKRPVPWSAVRMIDSIDKKELGDAMTASQYAVNMASQFLNTFKLRSWQTRESSGQPVTPEYRLKRAQEVGQALVDHDRWKSHGHSISREVLWNEIRLKIDHPDESFERLIRRAWAVCYWIFDKTPVQKMLLSRDYSYVKHTVVGVPGQ